MYPAVYTLYSVLSILAISPIYDMWKLHKATPLEGGHAQEALLGSSEGLQAKTQLNLVMTVATIVMLHLIRTLGWVLGELESKKLSEKALMKEVRGFKGSLCKFLFASPSWVEKVDQG